MTVASVVAVVRPALAGLEPRVAIVLGSGLGGLGDHVDDARRIAYQDIPGFPVATVAGHAGELVAGTLDGIPVILQSGRFHLYEGHRPETVVLPVRLFAELGARVLVVTNAAGGLRPSLEPPALMLIADHINLGWMNPLIGLPEAGEDRFPDMSAPYDPPLRAAARAVAQEHGIRLEEGVYAAVLGPNYETPAEVAMLRRLGADAVGMSTVPEVLVARARGIRVLGISAITNLAAGLAKAPLSHEEVVGAGAVLTRDLDAVVRGVVKSRA